MNMIKKGIAIILLLGILGGTVFVFSRLTNNFKNFDKETISKNGKDFFDKKVNPKANKKVGFKALSTESLEEIDFNDSNINLSKGVTFASSMNLTEGESAEYVPTSFNFLVEIEPIHATVKDFIVEPLFENSDSTWAIGKNINDYIETTINNQEVTVTCKKPFGERINLKVSSVSNPEKNAILKCDFLKACDFKLNAELYNWFNIERENNTFKLTYKKNNLRKAPSSATINGESYITDVKMTYRELFVPVENDNVGTIYPINEFNSDFIYDLNRAAKTAYFEAGIAYNGPTNQDQYNLNIITSFNYAKSQKFITKLANLQKHVTQALNHNPNIYAIVFDYDLVPVKNLIINQYNHTFK